jgi:hypothetical protein
MTLMKFPLLYILCCSSFRSYFTVHCVTSQETSWLINIIAWPKWKAALKQSVLKKTALTIYIALEKNGLLMYIGAWCISCCRYHRRDERVLVSWSIVARQREKGILQEVPYFLPDARPYWFSVIQILLFLKQRKLILIFLFVRFPPLYHHFGKWYCMYAAYLFR